jgi:AcrR family transcriptional regulator
MAIRLPAARRRRQLLEVALVVFARDGYHGTSMDDVAEAAGVTKPVLYQHFRSKRLLYLELLEDVGGQLLESITKAVASAEGPRQQVEAGFTAYYQFVVDKESAFQLLFGGGARPDEEFSEAVRRVEDTIAAWVASLIEADLNDEHRLFLAHGIVGLAESTSRRWVLQRPEERPAVLVLARRMADVTWAGLRGVHRD